MTRRGLVFISLIFATCACAQQLGFPSGVFTNQNARDPAVSNSQLISDWNYVAQGAPASGDSDTRSTTATYFNSSGGISSAAINTARFDYTGGSAQGWLVEAAATNVSTYSVVKSPWTTFNSGSGSTSVVLNNGVSPDGTTTLAQTTINRSLISEYAEQYNSYTILNTTLYTRSVWLGPASGTYIGSNIQIGIEFLWNEYVFNHASIHPNANVYNADILCNNRSISYRLPRQRPWRNRTSNL